MTDRIVPSQEIMDKISEALGFDISLCQRIVLDLQVDRIPTLYVQMVADERVLNLDWPGLVNGFVVKWGNGGNEQCV